ncbi:MAG TPA: TMEM175 family protein [Gaiellaceae bacterium]|nr:TMEM175 family protein [Gaiellaceae bacterium]
METGRLEAFSDGVFAIATTLLVLEIAVPHLEEPGELGQALLDLWPSYLAYATSFLTIGIMWVNHHTVFRQLREADFRFLYLNLGLLMLIAFVPFPTVLLADYAWGGNGREAAITYGVTMTITALLFNALWRYAATGRRLLRPDADPREVNGISRAYLPGPFMYGATTLVALASPETSAALYLAIAVFYMLSSSVFGDEAAIHPAE